VVTPAEFWVEAVTFWLDCGSSSPVEAGVTEMSACINPARKLHIGLPMKNEKRSEYFTRDSIMKLLSDDELASVTTAESAGSLADGDEYVDLEQLDQGVRTASGVTEAIPMGRVVARKAVHTQTWIEVVAQLASRRIAPVHSEESNRSQD
jgi:hypothetical protein